MPVAECPICLEETRLRAWPGCHHAFCVGCTDRWVRNSPNCPLCRECMPETMRRLAIIKQLGPDALSQWSSLRRNSAPPQTTDQQQTAPERHAAQVRQYESQQEQRQQAVAQDEQRLRAQSLSAAPNLPPPPAAAQRSASMVSSTPPYTPPSPPPRRRSILAKIACASASIGTKIGYSVLNTLESAAKALVGDVSEEEANAARTNAFAASLGTTLLLEEGSPGGAIGYRLVQHPALDHAQVRALLAANQGSRLHNSVNGRPTLTV